MIKIHFNPIFSRLDKDFIIYSLNLS